MFVVGGSDHLEETVLGVVLVLVAVAIVTESMDFCRPMVQLVTSMAFSCRAISSRRALDFSSKCWASSEAVRLACKNGITFS